MAAVNVEESIPSIQTPAVSDNFKVEKEIGNKAQSKLAHTAEVAGWKAGKRAEAYHSQIADFSSQDKTTTDIPSHPRVLLLLPGDQSSAVNETLRTLRSLRNFDQNRLMISLGCCGAEAEKTRRLLEVDFPELHSKVKEAPTTNTALRGRSRLLANSARDAES